MLGSTPTMLGSNPTMPGSSNLTMLGTVRSIPGTFLSCSVASYHAREYPYNVTIPTTLGVTPSVLGSTPSGIGITATLGTHGHCPQHASCCPCHTLLLPIPRDGCFLGRRNCTGIDPQGGAIPPSDTDTSSECRSRHVSHCPGQSSPKAPPEYMARTHTGKGTWERPSGHQSPQLVIPQH